MNSVYLAILLLFVSELYAADNIKDLKSTLGPIPCAQRFYSLMQNMETVTHWTVLLRQDSTRFRLFSRTTTPGVTLSLISDDKFLEVTREDRNKRVFYTFRSPDCGSEVRMQLKTDKATASPFDDEALATTIEESKSKNQSILLYVWSPNMNLSLDGVEELATLAEKKPWKVIFLVSPLSSDQEIQNVCAIRRWPSLRCRRLTSRTLIERSALVHFPTLFVINKGRFNGQVRPGYDTPERLDFYLKSLDL